MDHDAQIAASWNISTSIGPIVFNISIGNAFFQYAGRQHVERHQHSAFEFHIIAGGAGVILTDEMQQHEVAPGSYYIVKAGVYHTQMGSSGEPLQKISFKFEFDISNGKQSDYSEDEIRNFVYLLSNITFFYSRNHQRIRGLIDEIHSEFTHRRIGYYTRVQHLFALVFIEVIRDIAAESRLRYEIPDKRKLQEDRSDVIEHFFEFNCNYKATSDDLCKLLHISKSQLNRILKEKYHMTFKRKHMETQIELIKDLLVNTDLSIGAISEKTGYTSECNFTTFFKGRTGLSPKAYRKQQREDPAPPGKNSAGPPNGPASPA